LTERASAAVTALTNSSRASFHGACLHCGRLGRTRVADHPINRIGEFMPG
jgi:hypothetical protein